MERKTGHEVIEKTTPEEVSKKPTPDNFDAYLPWACIQLEFYAEIVLIKTKNNEYVNALTDRSKSSKIKTKRKTPTSKSALNPDEEGNEKFIKSISIGYSNVTYIYTVYDHSNNLVQLKFNNNGKIPTRLLQIIRLIIQFQVYLTNITINRGLNKACLYELNKLLKCSNVTEVCLDYTVIPEANYDLLLDNPLKLLSLGKCKIEDDTVKKIISKLSYPLTASKTLSILNLASNKITDAGAISIAAMLRTNRQLAYLNLADNSIEDDGAIAIFNILTEFPLSEEEIMSYKTRLMEFWQQIQNITTDERNADDKKAKRLKAIKRMSTNLDSAKKNKIEKEMNTKSTDFDNFIDPFSSINTTIISGRICSFGNNNLAYLNLSYNNLSYFTIKKLLSVLKTQLLLDRTPRGLVSVSIEGNCLPAYCNELNEINDILESILSHYGKHSYHAKKKSQVK